MRTLSARLGDPRLHVAAVLVLVLMLCTGVFGWGDSAPCPACLGHNELARDCLCYHAPVTPDSFPH